MALNVNNPAPIKLGNEVLRYVDRFTYLGRVFTKGGGADEDINRRLSKARTAFRMLEPVWRSSQYSYITKIKLYQSCVVSVLLYGSECWKMTDTGACKVNTFHTKTLWRIMKIFWPLTITNKVLLQKCGSLPMSQTIMKHRWTWIGHVLQQDEESLAKMALYWIPEGKRHQEDQRLHGREQWNWKCGMEERLGDNWVGWLKTAASGEILLLPYVPGVITGSK